MSDLLTYLAEIELVLVSSLTVSQYKILRSWIHTDDGYIRVQVELSNGDFLEAAEYFVLQEGVIRTVDYHHQWMDGGRATLRRRWDSTPHYPELESFPHHVHIEDNVVVPGRPMSLITVLRVLDEEI